MDIDDIEREFLRIKTCLDTGQDCLGKKQYGEAKKLFEEALALCDRGHSRQHPDRLKCLLKLSETLMAMKDFAGAASNLNELIDSQAGEPGLGSSKTLLLLKLSYCLEKSGRLKEACDCYEELIERVESEAGGLDPTLALIFERYKAVLGRMSVHGAKVSELENRARVIRRKAHGGESRGGNLFETAEELYGQGSSASAPAKGLRGRDFGGRSFGGPGATKDFFTKQLPGAIAVLAVIALLVALTRPVSQGQLQGPKQQFAIAKASCLAGDYVKASEIFDRLLLKDGKLAAAYWYNGGCKVKLADYEGAVKNYTYLIGLKADCEPAYVGRAGAYLFSHEYEHALSDCNEAIRINPKDAHAYDFRGAAYMHLAKSGEAQKDLQKVSDIGHGEKLSDAYIWEALPDPVFILPVSNQRAEKKASP